MPEPAPFEHRKAHESFSTACFNRAWELIETTNRSDEETEEMLQAALASVWHWTQRPDCAPRNLAIGYWQASRVFALAGQPGNALRYAELSMRWSEGESPFLVGYAYEAIARAAGMAGLGGRAREALAEARRLAALIEDEDERQLLLDDIEELG